MSLEDTYSWIDWSSWAVIVGVAIEETPMLLTVTTFLKEKLAETRSRTGLIVWLRYREKWIESFGFLLLVIGLLFENRFQNAAQSKEADVRQASERIVVELRAATAPREVHIPNEFTLTFIGTAQPTGVMVQSYAFDAEGARLATTIANDLTHMDFVVLDNILTKYAGPPMVFGVYVSGDDQNLVNLLIAWLNESDLHATEDIPPSAVMSFNLKRFFKAPSATIFVGSKPLP